MTLARTSSGWHAVAGFMVTMRDRLRWSLEVLTAVIGLTVYAAAAGGLVIILAVAHALAVRWGAPRPFARTR